MIEQICNSISNEDSNKDNKNKKEENKNKEEEDNNYYYEDFLKDIKSKSNEDFLILTFIKDFIKQKLDINEISYHTGIKIKDILNTVKKYEYIFDLVVAPLYNVKK